MFSQAVALHNVSYKGQVSLCNVAFMTHYDMSLHIMMGFSNRLYVIAYCCSQQNGPGTGAMKRNVPYNTQ
jgi:hypothetical protein